MKNHFFFGYSGNKRCECDDLYNEIKDKLQNIKLIVEPFCGTSAFSYYISLKHPKQFKYILNDNSKHLMELYSVARDEKELENLIKLLDAKIKDLNKEKYDIIAKEDTLVSWVITHKIYSMRAGLFPTNKKIISSFNCLKDCPIINFLRSEDITFYNKDGVQIINQYKDNKENFIFLDPPYLISCNSFYDDCKVNVYEYLYSNQIKEMKALLMICLESNWIIKLLFNDHIKKEYFKLYQPSKKTTSHLIISNF